MSLLDMMTTILHSTIVYSTPLILAALGGAFSERSGVVNIGLEGLMTIGAFVGAIAAIFIGETTASPFLAGAAPWIALLLAALVGVVFAIPHAVASVSFRADQVVSGVALNFLAIGVSVFLVKKLFDGAAQTTTIQNPFSKVGIPGLENIPYLGKALFQAYPTSFIVFGIVALTYFIFYKTPFGLRLRAVGEHPKAADTMGIRVERMRYFAVMISGALAAMGGALLPLTITNSFTHNTITGQGFIALAALIFGKWHPVGAMGAALFFGASLAIATAGQVIGLAAYIPVDFLQMVPYVFTILALAGVVGRAEAPKAIGKPYEKGVR
jgi:ABC-type uncharacterized transport system permease subunit